MTSTHDVPVVDLYTRNGFQGPASFMVRESYSPGYLRVEGTYRPQRLRTWAASDNRLSAPRALPVTILRSPTVRVDLWRRETDTPFAVRDVHRDQLLFVEAGHARLETDFGVLDLEPQDFVLISRSVSFRLTNVDSLQTIIFGTPEPLRIAPDNPGMLDVLRHVQTPGPYGHEEARCTDGGDYELILRHGDETTSYFYDYDPLRVLDTAGAPAVQRFNLRNVKPLVVEGDNASPPGCLVSGATTETLIYYLGSRKNGRPPIHHNADYDELCLYTSGPGFFGHMNTPGTSVWVPKGVIHQGPEEDVPEGYLAFLLETRANLELTPVGAEISDLIETRLFGIHPSASVGDTA